MAKRNSREMNAAELEDCQAVLHWSTRCLGRELNVSEAYVRKWTLGVEPVPPLVAGWLRLLRDAHLALPAPRIFP